MIYVMEEEDFSSDTSDEDYMPDGNRAKLHERVILSIRFMDVSPLWHFAPGHFAPLFRLLDDSPSGRFPPRLFATRTVRP